MQLLPSSTPPSRTFRFVPKITAERKPRADFTIVTVYVDDSFAHRVRKEPGGAFALGYGGSR